MTTFAVDLAAAFRRGSSRGERSQFSSMGMQRDQFMAEIGDRIDCSISNHRAVFAERRAKQAAQGAAAAAHAAFKIARAPTDPKERWVNGTPEYSLGIANLRKLFPRARFIHLVRDCDSVVRSLMNFERAIGIRLIETAEEGYRRWAACVKACLAAESAYGPTVVRRLTHQELKENPAEFMRQALEFLGESFDEVCLEPLNKKINSSGDEATVPKEWLESEAAREARSLWQQIKKHPQTEATDSALATQLDEEFEARVTYICELNERLSQTQQEYRRLEDRMNERTQWALRLKDEVEQQKKIISQLQEKLERGRNFFGLK